jgi:hypothetical protein
MQLSEVHASHKMEYSDFSSDSHSDHLCLTCQYYTCVLCTAGEGEYDSELAAPCIGFPWYEGVYGKDGLLGRKSGTGWPKKRDTPW